MKKKVLGFDVSSNTIGYGFLEIDEDSQEITYLDSGYLKPSKKGTVVDRIFSTRNDIRSIIDKYKPDYIGIEEIVQFMQGKSTAKTIIMLTSFNRMICLCAYDYLNRSPELFSVMSIRHGLKEEKELPKKEDMPELVSSYLGINFDYEYNKKEMKKPENYDRADGIAVALYYAMVLTQKIKRKTKTKKKKSKK